MKDEFSGKTSKIKVVKKADVEKKVATPQEKVVLFEQRLVDIRRRLKSLDKHVSDVLDELKEV